MFRIAVVLYDGFEAVSGPAPGSRICVHTSFQSVTNVEDGGKAVVAARSGSFPL
eukprot:jgi/Botrbrau1/21654/Bobra.43_1s0054.1